MRNYRGPKDLFLLISFDDQSNPNPTNGKTVPTMLLLNMPWGAQKIDIQLKFYIEALIY